MTATLIVTLSPELEPERGCQTLGLLLGVDDGGWADRTPVRWQIMDEAAQAWFTAGTVVMMAAGGGHAVAAVVDTVRPTFFAPIDDSVRSAMERSSFRFRRMWPRADDRNPSMYRLWLGFNISHGLGAFLFGLLCLLLASHDFALLERIDAIRALTIAVPAFYLALSLIFWFYVPALATGAATACFVISAALTG